MTAPLRIEQKSGQSSPVEMWPIPPAALGAWLRLQEVLEEVEDVEDVPCRVDTTGVWFPTMRTSAGVRGAQVAVEGCGVCPALDECRAYALAASEPHGIWGGLSAGDRRRLAKAATHE